MISWLFMCDLVCGGGLCRPRQLAAATGGWVIATLTCMLCGLSLYKQVIVSWGGIDGSLCNPGVECHRTWCINVQVQTSGRQSRTSHPSVSRTEFSLLSFLLLYLLFGEYYSFISSWNRWPNSQLQMVEKYLYLRKINVFQIQLFII